MSTSKTQRLSLLTTLCIGLGLLGLAIPSLGQTFTYSLLYAFPGPPDAASPWAGVIQGTDGNFYGTTKGGGIYTDAYGDSLGTVFKITPNGAATVLHSFSGYPLDGAYPHASLLQGSDGNFYGTTWIGGVNTHGGTVFKITPDGTETVLHTFSGSDGSWPIGSLIQGADGNFYGTTQAGGAYGHGAVYKITPAGIFTVLYSFHGPPADGSGSQGSLIQATDGNFYGTTQAGGAYEFGTVFKVTSDGIETVLHSFSSSPSDGMYPVAGLIQGTDGNFYGSTWEGGAYSDYSPDGLGTIFKITPDGVETVLHSFVDASIEGAWPFANLLQGTDGNFYGTTFEAGPGSIYSTGSGTIFKITPGGAVTVLHSFNDPASDAYWPFGGLIQGTDGNFYGTASAGGPFSGGGVFRLSGLYPLPSLAGLSPGICNAGSPAFTLLVRGSNFQPFSTIHWNDSALPTTYQSSSILKASVPASLVAVPGTARISVVTGAGGGTSNIKKLPIRTTTLKVVSASLTKNVYGGYNVDFTLQNTGYLSASDIFLTHATLGTITAAPHLHLSMGTLAAGQTYTTSLMFPSSTGVSGAVVYLTLSGSFIGGTFWQSMKVTLP